MGSRGWIALVGAFFYPLWGNRMTDILQTEIAVEVSHAPVRRRRTRRTLTAVDVVAVGAVTYLVAALLNASDLQRMAQRQPLGTHREVAVSLTDTLRDASRSIGLDQPGRLIEQQRGVADVANDSVIQYRVDRKSVV